MEERLKEGNEEGVGEREEGSRGGGRVGGGGGVEEKDAKDTDRGPEGLNISKPQDDVRKSANGASTVYQKTRSEEKKEEEE